MRRFVDQLNLSPRWWWGSVAGILVVALVFLVAGSLAAALVCLVCAVGVAALALTQTSSPDD